MSEQCARAVASLSLATLLCVAVGRAQQPSTNNCQPATGRHAVTEGREIAIQTPNGTIAGAVADPADALPRSLALLLDGYTGARDEIPVAGGEGMFACAARAFARRGIATLRIDFSGPGHSDGDWADTRFSTQARDAVRAARALRVRHGVAHTPRRTNHHHSKGRPLNRNDRQPDTPSSQLFKSGQAEKKATRRPVCMRCSTFPPTVRAWCPRQSRGSRRGRRT